MTWVYVAVGAALGAPLRYLAGHLWDGPMPWGTMLVNWVGSLLLGWFTGMGLNGNAIALLGTGFCGGLTTYSSFVVQSHARGPRRGSVTVVATLIPALVMCWLGFTIGAQA